MKLAHNSFFFAKMTGLALGIVLILTIRSAVYARAPGVIQSDSADGAWQLEPVQPWVVKLIAIASILNWFGVATAGRWIGFS